MSNQIDVDLDLKCEDLANRVKKISEEASENWAAAQQMFRQNMALRQEMAKLETHNGELVAKVKELQDKLFDKEIAALDPVMTAVPRELPEHEPEKEPWDPEAAGED